MLLWIPNETGNSVTSMQADNKLLVNNCAVCGIYKEQIGF